MVYLRSFELPDARSEHNITLGLKSTNVSYYPINLFSSKEFESISFDPITIFYGGNGSGKTTLLNIIARKIFAARKNPNDLGEVFDAYLGCCMENIKRSELREAKFISSDDIFDYLLDIRAINSKISRRKDDLTEEYLRYKSTPSSNYGSIFSEYEELKNKVDANRLTASSYIRKRLVNNTIIQESNGESALAFWQNEITENGLYIIDEPENSLSAENQLKLKEFIEESARFYNCQFIIATHSPFILSLTEAKIYDLDTTPVTTKKWTDLENVNTYYHFFKEHEKEFEKSSK